MESFKIIIIIDHLDLDDRDPNSNLNVRVLRCHG